MIGFSTKRRIDPPRPSPSALGSVGAAQWPPPLVLRLALRDAPLHEPAPPLQITLSYDRYGR